MALQDIDPQYWHETSRYRELARLEAYLEGSQYDKIPYSWWDDRVPMRERAPCIVEPLPRTAVGQVVRFAIGEGKFPKLKVEESDAAEEPDASLALSKDEAKELASALSDVVAVSCAKSALRTAMRRGLSARTAVLVLSLKDGRFRFEQPSAKDCCPIFKDGDIDGDVDSLVWAYQFTKEEPGEDGRPVQKRYFFRRDYDAANVTHYEDALVEHGKKIEWRVREVVPHGLGECPVVWVRNLSDEGDCLDGVSLYDGLLDEFDALNQSLSQRRTGLDILGVPQPYELGVQNGDGPGPAGRAAVPKPLDPAAPGFGGKDQWKAINSAQPARKGGPQYMWSYKGSEVELGLLETTGKAFEVSTSHVNDIRSRLLEAMNVILLDPTTVAGKGDMSAKALALMYGPMLALVDELREWWWERCIRRVLEMMMRIVSRLKPGAVLARGGKRMAELLQKRTVTLETGEQLWLAPRVTPLWGDYFAQSSEEARATVEAAANALEKGLVAGETATRYVASTFGVEDIEDELEDVAEEAAQAQEEAMAQMQAEADIAGPPKPGPDPKAKPAKMPGAQKQTAKPAKLPKDD